MTDDDSDDARNEAPPPDASEPQVPGARRRRRRRGGRGEVSSPQASGSATLPETPSPAPVRRYEQRGDPARNRGDQPRNRGDQPNRGEPRRRDRGDREPAPVRAPDAEQAAAPPVAKPRLDDRDHDAPANEPASIAWGTDDDGPAPDIALAANLLPDPPLDEDDPTTADLFDAAPGRLGDDVVSACGVRFVPGGRVSWFDGGDGEWVVGDRLLVDTDRGSRLGWVAAPSVRRTIPNRDRLRRVIRRASDHDLRGERESDADRARVLRVAKDKAAALRLPVKVFRVELSGAPGRNARINVYYTSDERLELRDFIREVTGELGGGRVELRQLGVRDEAKAVGGIGSCGLTLCCTTWLPDFVPVSIKMAKDQGLVLSPTKVSGQCGRLKCCLVYEQAGYAELRKGLPKLGKRVIGSRGEGRVVEVDVLRQRVRVAYGPGDSEVVPAVDVKPVFPSGGRATVERAPEAEPEETDDPSTPSGLEDLADEPELPDADPSRDPNADD